MFHLPLSYQGLMVVDVKMYPKKGLAAKRYIVFCRLLKCLENEISSAILHILTSSKSTFQWTPPNLVNFPLFPSHTSAPILSIAYPRLQFMVPVNALDVGIGCVLCQRFLLVGLFRQLSPRDRNTRMTSETGSCLLLK